jgi:zinc protease
MKRAIMVLALVVLLLVPWAVGECAFKLPVPEKVVLKNGLSVYYLRNADFPLISFRMFIRGAGSAFEPDELEGIANLTADLILKGTSKMDAEAIAEAIDFMGARLNISASEEYAGVMAESLAEHFPRLMGIAADCLAYPSFKDEEFTKERAKRIDNIKAIKDDPGEAVGPYFQKAYFDTHPMGHISSGTESSLKKMTVADVKSFYKTYFRPQKAIAAVVGDIDKPKLVELLNSTLGTWKNPGSAGPFAVLPPLPKPKGQKLVLVDKPDATQAYWVLGAPGYAMGDKITPAADVMNTLFGGRFTSWLSTELRIKRGLTYGAGSDFQTWSIGGLFTASSYTRNEKIGEMLDLALGLLPKARNEGFSAEEIESSRNYLQGMFPQSLETNAAKATAYLRLVFFNLGFDYFDKYLVKIKNATAAEAKDAAIRLLPESDYVLVVVGKAAEIRPLLAKYGTWQEKKITDPDF